MIARYAHQKETNTDRSNIRMDTVYYIPSF
jgi:hypothetical protein